MLGSFRPLLFFSIFLLAFASVSAQDSIMSKLPDTGQSTDYTAIDGEDSDYSLNLPSYMDNGNGTIKDNVTKLTWQKVDGGEMTWEMAKDYCDQLTLAGYSWRLPDSHELFGILNHDKLPAIDDQYFSINNAEYWWTFQTRADDTSKVWVVNAGGGIGAHPKNETVSAGGSKRFNARCVKDDSWEQHYTDNGDGTITDSKTGLIWIKNAITTTSWFDALNYAEQLNYAGHDDWRLPNIKELQSISEVNFFHPSIDTNVFPLTGLGIYWSSTTMFSTDTLHTWTIDFSSGIASYTVKSENHWIRCVRGGNSEANMPNSDENPLRILIFPNPAYEGIANIDIHLLNCNSSHYNIEVFDCAGILQHEENLSINRNCDYSYLLNIANYPTGVYFIKCSSNGKSYTSSLIIL